MYIQNRAATAGRVHRLGMLYRRVSPGLQALTLSPPGTLLSFFKFLILRVFKYIGRKGAPSNAVNCFYLTSLRPYRLWMYEIINPAPPLSSGVVSGNFISMFVGYTGR